MPVSPPTGRIGPLKSRRGCKVCKTRKIKCGEEKPSCHRCLAAKYKCEYAPNTHTTTTYSSAPTTTTILDRPLSTSPNTVWRERRAFAYYFEHAAPYLAGGLDQAFWGSVVPQVCRTQPAVWDAVNAISTLFESPNLCSDFVFLSRRDEKAPALNRRQSEALAWYARSLAKIRTQIERGAVDAQVALVSCVLFVCIETLQGRVEEALQLYQQGVRLILDLRKGGGAGSAALLESTIVPLFIRLGTVALTISSVPACDLFDLIDLHGEYSFTSLEAARDALIPLAYRVLMLQNDAGSNPWLGIETNITPELLATQITLRERLKQWHHAYTELAETISTKPASPNSNSQPSSNSNTSITALLLTYHTTLNMIVATCLTQNKSVYDAHIPGFRTIVEQASRALDASASSDASQPVFTFELGVGLPLFWTALECREPSLRRRALALLRRAPPMQGFYKCAPGIALAGKIMQLEEGFAKQISLDKQRQLKERDSHHLPTPPYDYSSEDADPEALVIPEEARIRHYSVFRPRDQPFLLGPHDISKWDRDQLFMRFARYHPGSAYWESWGLTDEIVPME
ncbi:hypothetical protein ASPCAL13910 [Aspergillus calidoustus]|uniref:Zn(2)-C6 fungal-type domain-containing protein n=1 Tax=Aspergillus calidoustus TaxID=454130 RepID=A0A0U5GLJ2_ASPCI|nr:hypothetical protein ASPCAL13910 [Aspergillus calidoustus]